MHDPTPRRRRLGLAVAAAGLVVGLTLVADPALAAPAAASVTLTAPTSAHVGDTIDVDVTLHGTSDVFGYQLAVAFDSAALAYVAGSATGPAGGFDAGTTSATGVTLVHTRLGTSPALSGDVVASVKLKVLATGTTTVSVSSAELVDPTAATATVSAAGASADVVATRAAGGSSGGSGGSGGAAGAGSGTGSAGTATGPLASTGVDTDVTALILVGIGAIVAGALVVVLLRRRAARVR